MDSSCRHRVGQALQLKTRRRERRSAHVRPPVADPHPDAGGKDFIKSLNSNSLKMVIAIVDPSLANAKPDDFSV